MGKRRIRCLKKLGITDICGYDPRPDRCNIEGVQCSTIFSIVGDKPEAVFICTPPDHHLQYMQACSQFGIPFFVEHGIFTSGLSNINSDFCYPSATMLFQPQIIELRQMLEEKAFGKISNIIYHCGQYLPDWHPHEPVSEFYVSKKETGGAREIVPFELTWLVDLFGAPKVTGNVRKTIDIPGAEAIDDTYNILLDWGNFLGILTVDVVSRMPIRRLLINGSERQAAFDLNQGITEDIYVAEVKAFLDAVKGGKFPNSLQKDIAVLKLLKWIEA